MIFNRGFDVKSIVSKGYIEDLFPYLDNDPEINRDMFLPSVLKTFEHKGIMYQACLSFYLHYFVGSQEKLGDISNWSIAEMSALLDKHDTAAFINIARSSDNIYNNNILYYAICYNIDSFVDYDTNSCSFDSDEFKELLEFVKNCPLSEDEGLSISQSLQEGKALLFYPYPYVPQMTLRVFFEYPVFFGGEISIVGFPNENGTACLVETSPGISMTTWSQNKAGAWSFIRTLLTKESQEDSRTLLVGGGIYTERFKTNKESMDAIINHTLDPRNWTDGRTNIYEYDGIRVIGKIEIPTQEDIDRVMELIDNAKPLLIDSIIMDIIYEEANLYIYGGKSLDETARVIQDRVSTYLGEQS
jgi:hypothetical protein